MGYELYIDPEVQSWLDDLRKQSRGDARVVDKALDRLRKEGAAVGPPFAVPVTFAPTGGDILPELDYCYQLQLKAMARVRAEVSDAASLRATLELHLEQPLTDEQADRLRAAYDGIRAQEEMASKAAVAMQRDVEAFRVRRETLKATCTAALTDGLARLFSVGQVSGDDGVLGGEPPRIRELRPGAPGRVVARLLFTAEGGRTAEVFAAATEAEVLSAWHARAIPAAYPEYGLRVTPASAAVQAVGD